MERKSQEAGITIGKRRSLKEKLDWENLISARREQKVSISTWTAKS